MIDKEKLEFRKKCFFWLHLIIESNITVSYRIKTDRN